MIRNTFSLLNGIGEKLERRLWRRGILTWEDFIGSSALDFISPRRKRAYDWRLKEASDKLSCGNAAFFAGALKCAEHWRLFEEFRGSAVCLDIETSGFQPEQGGYPTVVGLYDGTDYRSLVWGRNLSARNLMLALSDYKYLITFYGSAFDVPYLRRSMDGLKLDMPHFDLCFGARAIGLGGGLKAVERKLGIERDEATVGLDGYDAVLLWERARRGSEEAFDLLVRYNREDTVNLMGIAGAVYAGLRSSTGIEEFLG